MDTGFDFFKFIFSTETWTGIFTICAAVYGGYKAYKAKEADKSTKHKTSEIDTLKSIIDELQQERDNDKKELTDLRRRLDDAENQNRYISDKPTRKVTKSLRPPKPTKKLDEPIGEPEEEGSDI